MQVNELLRLCIQVWKYNLSGQERKQKQTNKQADDYFEDINEAERNNQSMFVEDL